MKEYDRLTFENLPEAVQHLINDVEDIKNLLLNQSADNTPIAVDTIPENGILNVEDVAQKLRLKEGTIYNLTHKRQIPYFKRGGRIYFDRDEINEWIRTDRRKTIKQLQAEAEMETRKI